MIAVSTEGTAVSGTYHVGTAHARERSRERGRRDLPRSELENVWVENALYSVGKISPIVERFSLSHKHHIGNIR
jgi:hypothetical protein